jgi:thiol-disulfide isomerase/thioredoxin
MIERLLVLGLIAITLFVVWSLVRVWRKHRIQQLGPQTLFVKIVPSELPAVVAFSTPHCADCRRQASDLLQLQTEFGAALTITTLNALEYPELVATLGLLTAPATAVLDPTGQVRYLNMGYVPAAQLTDQVRQFTLAA